MNFISKNIRRTTMLGVACVGVLLGLASVKFGFILGGGFLMVICGVVLAVGIWQRKAFWLPLVLIAGVVFGAIHASAFLAEFKPYELLHGKEVTLSGTVQEDPTYSKKGNRHIFVSNIKLIQKDQKSVELPGRIFASTPMHADLRRHDAVALQGKLNDGFGGFQGSIFYAKIEKIGEKQHVVDDLRSEFAASTTSALPEPHASLGLGFVIGMKSAMTPELEEALRNLALTHVVVASGYNLTILVRAAKRLREKRSKMQTLLISFGLIFLFLFVTGNSPSMVRAAAVSTLALGAWYFGRRFKPLVLLLLVMAATAFYNPTYLWGDLGWWLSFSAFFGIMIISPLLIERLWKVGRPSFVSQIAIEALVAQIMTMPIIMLVFGNFPILGVVANVLVVPLVPLAMLATAVAGFGGMIAPGLAPFLAIPATAILEIIISTIGLLNSVPGSTRDAFIGMPILIIWYVVAAALSFVLWQRLSKIRRQRVLEQQII